MSANFGRRLYTHLWESANPFRARIRNRISPPDAKVFDSCSTGKRFSTSKKATPLTRRLASGGFLVLGVSPSSTAAESGVACIVPSTQIAAQYVWNRALHTSNNNQSDQGTSSDRHSTKEHDISHSKNSDQIPPQTPSSKLSQEPRPFTPPNRHLMDRLPHMPHLHRPTKEELLAAATGFWSRLKVRFKWFSIRSVRPFNLDEITALFSWVLLGHVVWVVVGTTTFFSLLILAINTVFAQGMYPRREHAGRYVC